MRPLAPPTVRLGEIGWIAIATHDPGQPVPDQIVNPSQEWSR